MTKKIDELVDEAMSQAQVFASAWSLVGGPFDNGEMLENAEVEKRALRALIANLLSASIADTAGAKPVGRVYKNGDLWSSEIYREVVEGLPTGDYWLYSSHVAAPPAPSVADAAGASEAERFLTESDMASLFTFVSQVTDTDADGYTASKETMKRLAEIGCVESKGFGRYAPTMFGLWLIDSVFEQNSSLPLLTRADYNAKSAAMAKEAGE
ncbi:hypothetical protein [Caballeronia sp. NCTM1]|uniref:hypothetical protein n=1 Tax=Caballeronia sp. NCTM1 TaxID=2921753 RepID=UPI002027ABA8|nr:hypothetical protein [Caballeronia sp. NCTM1]